MIVLPPTALTRMSIVAAFLRRPTRPARSTCASSSASQSWPCGAAAGVARSRPSPCPAARRWLSTPTIDRPFARHDVGGGPADAAGDGGDQRDLVLEPHRFPRSDLAGILRGKTITGADRCRLGIHLPHAGSQATPALIRRHAQRAEDARAQRCLGQRAHHRAARAIPALAAVLRPGADADLGRRGDRAGAARHQRAGAADAPPAAARQGAGDAAQPFGRAADPRRRGRLAGARVRRARRARSTSAAGAWTRASR